MNFPTGGSNSAGRVRPCQGRCRGFESRLPLQFIPAMIKSFVLVLAAAFCAFAQDYKLEPIATAAPDLPAPYAAEIAAQGYRVSGPSGAWCEVWFRKTIPTGAK